MNRPVLNPMLLDGEKPPVPRPSLLRRGLRFFRIFGGFYSVLTFDILRGKPARVKIEDAPWVLRLVRTVFYRALFAPIFIVALAVALVWIGTHPPKPPLSIDPLSQGIYYDPVNYVTDDDIALEGWLVPTLDERVVLLQKENLIRQKRPAVVLVHDYGATRTQMVPLIRPFHTAGYVVLVVSVRGSDVNSPTAPGTTFGLRESGDIAAALDLLRRRPEIDPNRIILLGVGTGGNAALIAAEKDPSIAGLVLDHPIRDVQILVKRHFTPQNPYLDWIGPICKWTFELSYQVDAEDLDFERHEQTLKRVPALMLEESSPTCFTKAGLRRAAAFVDKIIGDKTPATAGTDLNR